MVSSIQQHNVEGSLAGMGYQPSQPHWQLPRLHNVVLYMAALANFVNAGSLHMQQTAKAPWQG